jgi:parallel beta-helix repeat protein
MASERKTNMTYVMFLMCKAKAMRPHFLATFLLAMLMSCATTLITNETFAEKSPIMTIMADGSIDPPTAPIERAYAGVYILTKDVTSMADGIVIERDNTTLDGQGHTIEGTGSTFSVGIYLSNKSGIALRNLHITGYHYGVELDSSSQVEISRNVVEANRGDGIFLNEVTYVNLTRNAVVSNLADGVFLYSSSNHNEISKNIVKDNNYRGLDFYGCHDNTILENDIISNNMTGIYLLGSSNNTIYHNNIVDNKVQAETYRSQNSWNDVYPSGGNYWSDYSGADSKTGPNQSNPGSDGIGDTPRQIDANNSDTYPLMAKWGTIAGDINNDGIVDIYDAILLSNAYSSTPASPNWNAKADFDKNNVIDLFDAIVLSLNYGKKL